MRTYRLEENAASDGQQVVTLKDSTGKVVWTKTRELADDEIVSTVFDSLHKPRWRIARPTQGWYLILQRVTARGADEPYIELKPAPKRAKGAASSGGVELVFSIQTPPRASGDAAQEASTNGRTSPTVRVNMSPTSEPLMLSSTEMSLSASTSSTVSINSASSTTALSDPTVDSQKTPTAASFPLSSAPTPPAAASTTHDDWPASTFRLSSTIPHTFQSEHPHTAGLLGRIKSLVAEPKKRWSVVRESSGKGEKGVEGVEEDGLVLAFEEQASGFFHPQLTGTLSLSPSLIDASGLEPSFWVALCCAYADVVEEREGWEAAKGGD
ncbi:hypothetical protein JCM8547_003879 [Rhodosporidiobolus lusitaniae]